MNVLQAQSGQATEDINCNITAHYRPGRQSYGEFPRFATTDKIWWQGLARILEGMGYIQEAAEIPRVLIQHPEPTRAGLKILSSQSEEEGLYAYPDAATLLAMCNPKPFSSFSEWGRGWADPEICCQRLAGKKTGRRKWKSCSRKQSTGFTTAKERLSAILSEVEAQKVT